MSSMGGTAGSGALRRSIMEAVTGASYSRELGHVMLGHKLVESTQPGKPAIGLLEPRRVFYEREARAFAAELLMPFAEVRRRWYDLTAKGISVEDIVIQLAEEYSVTSSAMRVRCQQMRLIRDAQRSF